VVNPDGSTAPLAVPPGLAPAADGAYTITHDFVASHAAALDSPGRYTLAFEAGSIDDGTGAAYPIARADLLVDVGRGAYIAAVAPEVVQCGVDAPAEITVEAGDLDAAQAGSVRLSVLGAGREVELAPLEGGAYGGSLEPLCQALLATLSCGAEADAALRVRLVSTGADGAPAAFERDVPVHVRAALCTATSTPAPSAMPTPTPPPAPPPTPLPDRDGDGVHDAADRCVDGGQWSMAPWWDGCPPPLAVQALGGLASAGVLAFLALYAAPFALVMTVQPPPSGYVQIFRNGKAEGAYKSLKSLGQGARSSRVTIGSEGMLRVAGLEPVELRVERRGQAAVVLKGAKGPQLFQVRDIPSTYTAANGIVLKFAREPRHLGR
jgi:hypothetical protein